MTGTLADHLSAIYRERVLHAGGAGAVAAFGRALAGDAALQASARAELARLTTLNEACQGRLAERCFVSAQHRETIAAALAALSSHDHP